MLIYFTKFYLIRYALAFLFAIVYLIATRKSVNITKNVRWVLALILMAVTVNLLSFLPAENLFYTFPSAESAYSYNNVGDFDYQLEGQESTAVLRRSMGETKLYLLGKTEQGWKIGMARPVSVAAFSRLDSDAVIRVYQFRRTEDYYIRIFHPSGSRMQIADADGAEFTEIYAGADKMGRERYEYYAVVRNYSPGREILINGQAFTVADGGTRK